MRGLQTTARPILCAAVDSFELEYVEEHDPHVAFIALVGELDLTNADALVEQLDAIAAGRALVLDLNRLLFLDSAALNGLFRVARIRGRDGFAIVIEPSSPVATTLEIVDFRRAATVVPSRDDAVTALSRHRST